VLGNFFSKTMKITDEIGQKILRDCARGVSVEDICRRHGVSREAFYRWRRLYFQRLKTMESMSREALHTSQESK
jgi:transposase-like protein